jgi:hypothetical protein
MDEPAFSGVYPYMGFVAPGDMKKNQISRA